AGVSGVGREFKGDVRSAVVREDPHDRLYPDQAYAYMPIEILRGHLYKVVENLLPEFLRHQSEMQGQHIGGCGVVPISFGFRIEKSPVEGLAYLLFEEGNLLSLPGFTQMFCEAFHDPEQMVIIRSSQYPWRGLP